MDRRKSGLDFEPRRNRPLRPIPLTDVQVERPLGLGLTGAVGNPTAT